MRFSFLPAIAVSAALAVFVSPEIPAAEKAPSTSQKQTVRKTQKKSTSVKASASDRSEQKGKRQAANKTSLRAQVKTTQKRGARAAAKSSEEVAAQRAHTRDKIEEVRTSISEKSSVKKKLEEEMKASQVEITKVRKRLQTLRQERIRSERRLKSQQSKVETLQAELAQEGKALDQINRERMELLATQQQPQWASSDPNQRMRTQMMLGILAKKSAETISRLEKSQKDLSVALNRTRTTGEKLSKTLEEERREQSRLTKERRERQVTANKLNRELEAQTQTLKKLQNDEKRLGDLVASLRRKETLAQKAEEKLQRSKKVIASAAPAQPPVQLSGRVNPVPGRVVARFGDKRTVGGKTDRWQGTVFSVNGDEEVRAVRAGKVVFSDYLRGYGNLIILDHGKGYYSVYGNNAALEKDIGDTVKTGEVISRAGKNGDSLSVLYFELRHNGKPIDPKTWLNI